MIWRLLRHNIGYKLIALALAIFLWLHVQALENPLESRAFEVPIRLINVPPHMVVRKATEKARVTLQGLQQELQKVPDSAVSARVDLTEAHRGTNSLAVFSNLATSAEVKVLNVQPSEAAVVLEEIVTHAFPLEPKFLLPNDISVQSFTLGAREATVRGPSDLVERVAHLIAKIEAPDPTAQLPNSSPVIALDAGFHPMSGITVMPDTVSVSMVVYQSKDVAVAPRVAGEPAAGFRVQGASAEPAYVTVTGLPRLVGSLASVATAELSVREATRDVSRRMRLVLPRGVSCKSGQEVTVTVHVVRKALPLPERGSPSAPPAPSPPPGRTETPPPAAPEPSR